VLPVAVTVPVSIAFTISISVSLVISISVAVGVAISMAVIFTGSSLASQRSCAVALTARAMGTLAVSLPPSVVPPKTLVARPMKAVVTAHVVRHDHHRGAHAGVPCHVARRDIDRVLASVTIEPKAPGL
jgi:hypothetical protein